MTALHREQRKYDRSLPGDSREAERLFDRAMRHSEAGRQEEIGRIAKCIARDIEGCMLTDDSEAIEIGGYMLGFMEPETMAMIIQLVLTKSDEPLRDILKKEMQASIERTAELRAIRQVEETTPDSYLPD